MLNVLQKLYNDKLQKELVTQFKLRSVMEAPKVLKVTINSGIGAIKDNKEQVESFLEDLTLLAGQKPYPRKIRKAEAGFKVRKGVIVGYAVTLRGHRMWAFLQKLVGIVLPRVRDFKGLDLKSFDEHGNYSIGISEHVVFPEVDANKVKSIRGLQVTISMRSKDKEQSKALLEKLGFVFKK